MGNNKGTILIADDDRNIREFIKAFLECDFKEYEIEEFENGNAVQSRLENELINPSNVQLLITDNDMSPGKKGSELIQIYSSLVKFPIILHYGGYIGIGKAAIENGAFGYLAKPCDFKVFNDLVTKALSPK